MQSGKEAYETLGWYSAQYDSPKMIYLVGRSAVAQKIECNDDRDLAAVFV